MKKNLLFVSLLCRGMEYCDGEMLRGFTGWGFVQQCTNGRLQLEARSNRQVKKILYTNRTRLQSLYIYYEVTCS